MLAGGSGVNWYINFLKIAQSAGGDDYGGWIAPDGQIHKVDLENHAGFITGNGWHKQPKSDKYRGTYYGQAFDRCFVRYVEPKYSKWNKYFSMSVETPEFITSKQLAALQRIISQMRLMSRDHVEAGEPSVYLTRQGSQNKIDGRFDVRAALAQLQSFVDDEKAVPNIPATVAYEDDSEDYTPHYGPDGHPIRSVPPHEQVHQEASKSVSKPSSRRSPFNTM
jgi:hypothetical protein